MERRTIAVVMLAVILSSLLILPLDPAMTQGNAHQKASETLPASSESPTPPTVQWNKTYGRSSGDWLRDMLQTDNGGFILAGSTILHDNQADAWLVETDAEGNMIWNETYGGAQADIFSSIAATSDGGYILTGYTYNLETWNDAWLVKVDSLGNVLLNKTYSKEYSQKDEMFDIIQSDDGGYAMVGYRRSNPSYVWLIKTYANGDVEWEKMYGAGSGDWGRAIAQSSDGGYVVAGYTYVSSARGEDAWLMKTDQLGNQIWKEPYGGSGNDRPYSVIRTSDGGYALAGSTGSFGGLYQLWLIKADSSGLASWNKTYGGPYLDDARSVIQLPDGGYVLAGGMNFYGDFDFWLGRTDSYGNLIWSETYGGTAGSEWAYSVVQTSDGGIAIGGDTASFGAGYYDMWLVKLAPPPRDVLVIDDARKYAFFGWYEVSQMTSNSVGWNLLERTVMWATSYTSLNETLILLFTYDGSLDPVTDADGKALFDKLISWGAANITVFPQSQIETLDSSFYAPFHLVINAGPDDYDSVSAVNSGRPFITFAGGQTDEMGIGSGEVTPYAQGSAFYVVNNNYYPTYDFPTGLFLLESAIEFKATQAIGKGKVLVKAEEVPIVSHVEMSMTQDIYLSLDGSANMTFRIIAHSSSPSPLADLYREAFFTEPPPYEPEAEYMVPENKTIVDSVETEENIKDLSLIGDVTGPEGWPDSKVDIRDMFAIAKLFGVAHPDPRYNLDYDIVYDATIDIQEIAAVADNYGRTGAQQLETENLESQQIDAQQFSSPDAEEPVREVFHQGITMEQAVLLGFVANVTDSKIVPWAVDNETRISVEAFSQQLAVPVMNSTWRVFVGPQDDNSTQMAAEFVFTKIQYIQQMLRSWPGEQTSQYDWEIAIHLPPQAELLNADELAGLNWTIDFGGGTSLEAHVAAGLQLVTLNETMLVTEQEITASDTYLSEVFAQYKVFKIDYSSPSSLNYVTNINECSIGGDWSKTWTYTISRGAYSKTWSEGPLRATVRVVPTFAIQWYVGWETKRWKLQWFETWMSITPSIKTEAVAEVTASYSKTWSYTFATWSTRFSFWVGGVPVWANLKMTITGAITVSAQGQISVTTSTTTSAWVKAGVKWTTGYGWSTIWNHGWGASLTGPSISASASLTLTPSAKARLAFLFYDVAGPFVEGYAYAPMTVTYGSNTWSISLKFKVIAGCTFSGWLKRLLDLNTYSRTLDDWTLASWSGNF